MPVTLAAGPAAPRPHLGYLRLLAGPIPARLGPGARRDAPTLRLPTGVIGVALTWPAVLPGRRARRGSKGVCSARSSGALLAVTDRLRQGGAPVGVIIGMDPHKRSATIEVVDERGRIIEGGRFGTDKTGYVE